MTTHIKLNRTACSKAVAPSEPKQRIWYYFREYPGLTLAVWGTGARNFYIYKKFTLKPGNKTKVYRKRLYSLEELIENSKLNDRKLITKLEAERNLLIDGQDPREVRKEEAARGVTYGELFKEYLQTAIADGKKSIRKMQYAHDRYFVDFISKPVSDISRRDVQNWVKKLQDGSFKDTGERKDKRLKKRDKQQRVSRHKDGKATAAKNLGQLRAVLNWGQKESVVKLQDDPTFGIHKPKVRDRERFMQPNELQKFYKALEVEPDVTARDCIAMLLATGARKNNVMAMRWQDINFDFQTWRIPDTKSGDSVTVALTPTAIEILRRRHNSKLDATWVFPGRKIGSKNHIGELKKNWAELLKRAELTDLRIHDLRRTAGSYMAIGGASLQVIGKALGHKTSRATEIYAKLHLDPVRQALQQAQELMTQSAQAQPAESNITPIKKRNRSI